MPACGAKSQTLAQEAKVSQKNHLDVVDFILQDLRDGKPKTNRCAPMLSPKQYTSAFVVINVIDGAETVQFSV